MTRVLDSLVTNLPLLYQLKILCNSAGRFSGSLSRIVLKSEGEEEEEEVEEEEEEEEGGGGGGGGRRRR